ncbi:MAG: AMP-binding protein [Spirochaetaceae bacterium]|jgi:long-chain acyl-CoA synthetase|nr:AMP-binding protein [Spirochaetaceae bacterium]
MLQFKDYIADWDDFPYQNFIDWLKDQDEKWGKGNAIYYRSGKQKDFTIWTHRRFVEECRRISRGILAKGFKKGDRIVLWCENRPEWMACWMGIIISGCIVVPVDYTITEDECANIFKITEARGFFHSGHKNNFAKSLPERGINVDFSCPISIETSEGSRGSGAYLAFGENDTTQELLKSEDIAPTDPASIVFTSGTTGFAKGVMLSHKGIISNVDAAGHSLRPDEHDIFISVLPLHHTYPTTCSFLAPLSFGGATIIVEKLVGKVVIDDIHDAKGTFLIAVPLLYDKFKAAIGAGYSNLPSPVRRVLNIFRNIALDEAKQGNPDWGVNFFKFFRRKARLETVRMMVAGGGALNPATADFFDSFGFNMVQGYGMSENSPLISVSTPWHRRNESVGLPVNHTEAKITDANEDGVGEITIKSPSIMLGYYKQPEATAEVIDSEGWLHTGDLGFIDDDGFIHINGRAKNLIVSAGGKNIYPEEIESHFAESKLIAEILVLGRKSSESGEQIFAVIVPNYEYLEEAYKGREHDDAFIRDLVKKEIEDVNRHLPSYKKISDFTIRKEPFEKNAQQKIRRFMYNNYTIGA